MNHPRGHLQLFLNTKIYEKKRKEDFELLDLKFLIVQFFIDNNIISTIKVNYVLQF